MGRDREREVSQDRGEARRERSGERQRERPGELPGRPVPAALPHLPELTATSWVLA